MITNILYCLVNVVSLISRMTIASGVPRPSPLYTRSKVILSAVGILIVHMQRSFKSKASSGPALYAIWPEFVPSFPRIPPHSVDTNIIVRLNLSY